MGGGGDFSRTTPSPYLFSFTQRKLIQPVVFYKEKDYAVIAFTHGAAMFTAAREPRAETAPAPAANDIPMAKIKGQD